jgi:uncharacterized protein YndB with AHSA1/START domain
MGILTSATIELTATPADVFRWLIEPRRLTTWLGAAGAMPSDPSLLKPGYTSHSTMKSPSGSDWATSLTVNTFVSPTEFSYTLTYPGGEATTTYALSATAAGTSLSVQSDTDYASADGGQVNSFASTQSWLMRAYIHLAVAVVEHKLAAGTLPGIDQSTQEKMQEGLNDSLAKLKTLVDGSS